MRPIWLQLDVPTGKREELARLTGIPPTNLSAMNTGKLPMTMEMAGRIVRAVPGVSLLDLGAPEAAAPEEATFLRGRLAEVSSSLAEVLDEQKSLDARLAVLEARAVPTAGAPKGRPAKRA